MTAVINGGASHNHLPQAVVGGGAAGLATALELRSAGHRATVFEKGSTVGGVWAYSEEVDDDPLSQGSRHVHGSMYANLRTNLPREVMAYLSFPFDAGFSGSADPRQFCSHQEVQRYLLAFADHFNLWQHVRLNTEVQHVAPIGSSSSSGGSGGGGGSGDAASGSGAPAEWPRWEVTTRPAAQQQQDAAAPSSSSSSSSSVEQFDAVVVANGHYSRPRLPDIKGREVFPGLVMHSHNYRRPEAFVGQTVVLLGASSSGVDIAEEIAAAGAKRVYLCARAWENPLTGEQLDITSRVISSHAVTGRRSHDGGRRSLDGASGGAAPGAAAALPAGIIKAANLQELHADGSVTLADGTRIPGVDAVMFATGYVYHFPFLAEGLVTVADNRVAPLYQHVFPPAAAPTLSFVGLPWKVVPFPQFQLQARWIARVLAGAAALPPQQEMEEHARAFYASLEAAGARACRVPVRYTHRMPGAVQWEYDRWLAAQCGEAAFLGATWREAMYNSCGLSRKLHAERYRDAPLPAAAEAEAEAREEAAQIREQLAAATAS